MELSSIQAAQVVLHLLAGDGEQRADNAVPLGQDASQPPQTGAPGHVEENGLHIVAGGVGGGNQVRPRLPRRLTQKRVAHIPGGLLNAGSLEAGLGGHVAGARIERDGGEYTSVGQTALPAAQFCELLHKPLVPVGLRPPEPVVVVGGGQGKIQPGAQPVQSVEHSHRVRSAGHGAQHPGAGGDQVLFPDKLFNGF